MVNIEINAWSKLQFHDPEPVVKKLRMVQAEFVPQLTDERIRNLRTPDLKPEREARDAAIFSYGMGKALNTKVLMARKESSDYDFVTCWRLGDALNFCPVQLKELPPAELNANIIDRVASRASG